MKLCIAELGEGGGEGSLHVVSSLQMGRGTERWFPFSSHSSHQLHLETEWWSRSLRRACFTRPAAAASIANKPECIHLLSPSLAMPVFIRARENYCRQASSSSWGRHASSNCASSVRAHSFIHSFIYCLLDWSWRNSSTQSDDFF